MRSCLGSSRTSTGEQDHDPLSFQDRADAEDHARSVGLGRATASALNLLAS